MDILASLIYLVPGVISGVGKGIIGTRQESRVSYISLMPNLLSASSSGLLLKTLGLRVTAIKIDPYLNIDAGMAEFRVVRVSANLTGTMSPKEHGECFVLNGNRFVPLWI